MHLNLKARVLLGHLVAVGLILSAAALGADWMFSRIVLGQVDQALTDLAETEAAAALAHPGQPIRVHEKSPGTAAPSLPRLDKFIQIVTLDGQVIARSGNLGSARLPTPASLLVRLRRGERVFETLDRFAEEPVRLLSIPVQVGGGDYAIQVGGSLDDARAALGSARLLFLAMAATILAAVVLTGALLARNILRPIDRIVQRARLIGQSVFTGRLPHPGTRDEMARLVETLNDMLGRMEQTFEAQRRFTADASHELRSPLSRLRAELEVTLRRPRERAEYEEALGSCLGEVERLSCLTEELLILARLDAGEREAVWQPVPLSPILDEAVRRFGTEARRRHVEVRVEAPAGLAVRVAPAAAGLVLSNVLDNALKFSPVGGQVRVGVAARDGVAVVAVSDAGPGIPEDEAPRLFERFYRGSAARSADVPGFGLGLAICRALVEGQGGSIGVANNPGGGATVSIRLPLAS
jgi:two-component system OmpR family sensor kinase